MFNMPSVRDHVLHNIDDEWGYAAIRKYNYKLVKGFSKFSFSIFPRKLTNYYCCPKLKEQLTMAIGITGMDLLEEITIGMNLRVYTIH